MSTIAYVYDYPENPGWHTVMAAGAGTATTRSVAVYLQTLFWANGATTTPFFFLPSGSTGFIDGSSTFTSGDFSLSPTGTQPSRCTLAATWSDRLILSGDEQNPHLVYGCRIDNFLDWDETKIDPASAFVSSDAFGKINPPVTTLIPLDNTVLAIGGHDALHVLRGNPSGGGQHRIVSTRVGPISNNGWCQLDDGSVVFMTRVGLYRVNQGGTQVESVSRNRLPDDLMGLDSDDTVSLAYDSRWNGIHIVGNSGSNFAYFLDMAEGGYWPMKMSFAPTMVMSKKDLASSDVSNVVLLKQHAAYVYDSGNADGNDCYLFYGPIPLGGQFGEGMLNEIAAVLGESSTGVSWSIYVGDSPQEAWAKAEADIDSDNAADFDGTQWTETGLNYVQRPMLRGNCFYLKIRDDDVGGSSQMVVEEIIGKIRTLADRRVT